MEPMFAVFTYVNVHLVQVMVHGLTICAYVAGAVNPRPFNVFETWLVGVPCFVQTVILIVTIPQGTVIGADSMVRVQTDNPLLPRTLSICKIHQTNQVVFAPAYLTVSATVGYDVNTIATKAFSNEREFSQNITQFENDVLEPLKQALIWTKQTFPESFQETIKGPVLDIVFATFEGDFPITSFRRFLCTVNSRSQINITIERIDWKGANGGRYRFLGHGETANSMIVANPAVWDERGIVEAVRFLIMVESAANPDVVGGPIDIICITKDGPAWIQRKPECY